MSRIKIHDLFEVARSLKIESRKLDLEWINTQRACVKELRRIEAESVRINRRLSEVLRKLSDDGFSELEVATGRLIKPKKGKKS